MQTIPITRNEQTAFYHAPDGVEFNPTQARIWLRLLEESSWKEPLKAAIRAAHVTRAALLASLLADEFGESGYAWQRHAYDIVKAHPRLEVLPEAG